MAGLPRPHFVRPRNDGNGVVGLKPNLRIGKILTAAVTANEALA